MFTRTNTRAIHRIGSRILAVTVILAFLGAAIPSGAALAQSNCQETYTVQSGDWLVKIAANYEGVSWSDIAEANNIEGPSYVIFVGQKLCIPKPGTTGSGSSSGGSGGVTGSTGTGATIEYDLLDNDRIEVSVENAQKGAFYYVKLDDTKQSSYTWYKVGTLSTGSDEDGSGTYNLPEDLEKATVLNICLKNTATDDLLCNNPSLTRLSDKDADDDDDDDDEDEFTGTFTVDRDGDDIIIETDDFPEDETFNVRVADLDSESLDFTVIGKLEVEDDPSDTYVYDLDGDLEDADELRVCLKNTDTDAQECVDVD